TGGSPSLTGTAPPARPVPDPRGTMARPCFRARRTTAWTSPVVVGKHTNPAWPSMTDASRAYRASSSADDRTRSGAGAAESSSTREVTGSSLSVEIGNGRRGAREGGGEGLEVGVRTAREEVGLGQGEGRGIARV